MLPENWDVAASKSNESTKLNPKVLISYTLVKVSRTLPPKLSLKHMLWYLYFILIFSLYLCPLCSAKLWENKDPCLTHCYSPSTYQKLPTCNSVSINIEVKNKYNHFFKNLRIFWTGYLKCTLCSLLLFITDIIKIHLSKE